MVGLRVNGILDLAKYRPLCFADNEAEVQSWWLFKVTWLCCLCRLEESWSITAVWKATVPLAGASFMLLGNLISKHITACCSHFSIGKGSSAQSQDELQREPVPSSLHPTRGAAGVWLRPELSMSGIKRAPIPPEYPGGLTELPLRSAE